MHEASIVNHLIEAVERRIDCGEITGRVRSIYLRVGRMTTVVPDHLRFLFAALSDGSVLQGAQLEIEEVMTRGRCRACGKEFDIEDWYLLCRECGSADVNIVSGGELMILGVEVD